MIKKYIPAFIRKILRKVVNTRLTYESWYTDFLKRRAEKEKQIPKFELEQKHIQNLTVLLDRESLLDHLPKNAVCAEIGVDKGTFSAIILKRTLPLKLHLVDAWGDVARYHDGLKEMVQDKFMNEIKQGVVELNVGYSTSVLKDFPDHYFDWVYLDTSHMYKVTAEELSILKDKVKPEGIIAGHDYIIGNWAGDVRYGVIEAVHELCLNNNWEFLYITSKFSEMPSFAIKRII